MTNKSVLASLIVALQCTANAFHAQSAKAISPTMPPCRVRLRYGNSICSLSLSMMAKSGGRLIGSTDQFEEEILYSGINKSKNGNEPFDAINITLPILVLFSAPWCGPCRLTNPVVKEVMKQYPQKIDVVEINTDDLPEVASKAGVLSIPTILIYHKGEVMDTIVGCVAKNVLTRSVDKVLEDLGMLEH